MGSTYISITLLAVNSIMYSLYYFYIFVLNRNRYLALWGFGWITYSLGYILYLSTADQIFSIIFKYSFSLLSSVLLLMGTIAFVNKHISNYILNLMYLLMFTVLIVSIIMPTNPVAMSILSLSTSIVLMLISVASGLAFLITDESNSNLLREVTGWLFILWGIHKGFYPFVSPDFYSSDINYMTAIILINVVNMTMILCYLDQNNKLILDQEVRFRKLAEASEKRHSDQELSRQKLLSNISHELRTPITSIIGNLSIITDGIENDNDKIKEYANISLEKSLTLNTLIQDLFELSSKEEMQLKLNREKFPADKIINTLNKKISIDMKDSPISLKILSFCKRRNRNCPNLFVDILRIEQVIQNMVNNAVKNIESKGTIVVSCQCCNNNDKIDENTIHIKVNDNGSGIAEEDIPHIFEMFYKKPNVKSVQGAGLGLALSKDIIRYHEGDIIVESQLGEGTEFTVILPCEREVDA